MEEKIENLSEIYDLPIADKSKTCCFTGHRRKALPLCAKRGEPGVGKYVDLIYSEIFCAVLDGYDTFITGMAEGVDLICAEILCDMNAKKICGDLKIICAIPFPGQLDEDIKLQSDKELYRRVLRECSRALYVSPCRSRDVYRRRNKFMVDNSSRLIGAVNLRNRRSGAMQTVNLAKKAGIDSHIIDLGANKDFYLRSDGTIDNAYYRGLDQT